MTHAQNDNLIAQQDYIDSYVPMIHNSQNINTNDNLHKATRL